MLGFFIFLPLLLISTTKASLPTLWSRGSILDGNCSLSTNKLVYEKTVKQHGSIFEFQRYFEVPYFGSKPITCIQVISNQEDGTTSIDEGGVGQNYVRLTLKNQKSTYGSDFDFVVRVYAEEKTTTSTATKDAIKSTFSSDAQDPTEWSSNITTGDCSSSSNKLVYEKTVYKLGRLLLPRLITKSFSNFKTITCIQVINHRTDGKTRISKGGVGEKSVKIALKSTGTLIHALNFDIKIYVKQDPTEWSSSIVAGDCSLSNNTLVYEETINKHARLLLPRLLFKSFSNSQPITCINVTNHRTDGLARFTEGGVGEKSVTIFLRSTGVLIHALYYDIKIYVEKETTTTTEATIETTTATSTIQPTTSKTESETEPTTVITSTTVKAEDETTTAKTEATSEKIITTTTVETTTTSKAEDETTAATTEAATERTEPTTVTTTTTAKPKEEITTTTVSSTEPTKPTTVTSTTPVDIENICKENPEDSYLRPHPTDCTQYISCDNDVAYIMPCATGTWFSQKMLVCVTPNESDCPYENGLA